MNYLGDPNTSNRGNNFEDDEIFDDSTFLANFDNTSFKQGKVSESRDLINTSALNVSALCCDEEISGYDKLTGRTWIYPTNYPVRDYQFNIIKAAMLKNTLVSLPTGLGKTFIAAVIMYNFYRWYPLGKIVFTAPTRPLVAQQIDACYNIIAIPPNDTIEMTGHMQVMTRKAHWLSKRVFFATPQVIYNDLKSGICPAESIRCLVMDEAHRARGNYAYCQIVGTLDEMGHKIYRMLALSATPGSKVDDVINVVKSLHIAHLELRTENCIDVAPYSHSRKINTVVVQLGPELSQLRQQYVEILDGYARRLKQLNILPQNLGNLSKGRVVMLYKEYQTKDRGARHHQHNYIMKDFTLLIALYHGLELLVKHGSRVFLNFFDEHPEKSWIQSDDRLTALLERLRDDLGVNPLSLDRSILPDGTMPEMPKDLCFGHPKFDKLRSIILEHFTSAKQKNQDTRAIIFCEYRESVNLVHCLLLQCRPLITPQMFVGQGASGKDGKAVVSQKQQLRVMRNFREGACNTLVATCVAEEGLDVGSVDLIICFDISTRSPVRLVQRCGRTGRERGGQVYILVTEGREHQTLTDCMRQRDGLNKKVLQSKEVENNLYKSNPRMIPHGFIPECQKMFITVAKKNDPKDTMDKPSKKGQKDLRSMLLNNRASTIGTSLSVKEADKANLITEEEFQDMFPDVYHKRNLFQKPSNYWALNKETLKDKALENNENNNLNLSSWLEWQRTLQKTVNVGHSNDSEFLSRILQKCDIKRLAASQNPVINTQEVMSQKTIVPLLRSPTKTTAQLKKRHKATVAKSPAKNNGDIRALFSTATKSTKNYTKLINDLGVQNDGNVSTKLINLLVDLNLNADQNNPKQCYICQNICDCKTLQNLRKSKVKPPMVMKFLEEPILPDLALIDEIDSHVIIKYGKGINESHNSFNFDVENQTVSKEKDKLNCSSNFDLEFDLDALDEIESPEVLVEEKSTEINLSSNKNFEIGDIDDIFANSSPEEAIEKTIQAAEKSEKWDGSKPKEAVDALGFFGLDSIDDIFADYEDAGNRESSINKTVDNVDERQITITAENKLEEPLDIKQGGKRKNDNQKQTNAKIVIESLRDENVPNASFPLSPSILSGQQKVTDIPTSPILCSQTRKFKVSDKNFRPQSSTPNSVRKKLKLDEPDITDVIVIDDEKDHNTMTKSVADSSSKSMFTVTQIVEMINKTDKLINDTNIISKSKDLSIQEQDERSKSPILMTQADRKKSNNNKSSNNKSKSLIILDSDSDFEDTLEYDVEEEISKIDGKLTSTKSFSPVVGKRKFDHDDSLPTASPYFNKKPKMDDAINITKPLTLQEKVLAAISSNKAKDKDGNVSNVMTKTSNNPANFHFTTHFTSQPNLFSQKENHNPLMEVKPFNHFDDHKEINTNKEDVQQSPIDVLQKYRKQSKILTLRSKFNSIFKKSPVKIKSPTKNSCVEDDKFVINDKLFSPNCNVSDEKENTPKRKIVFDETDDDFIDDHKNSSQSPRIPVNKANEVTPTANHKKRKKKRNRNCFIEMEASLSDDGSDSGDELTDDSAGSIAEFICDDPDVTSKEDIHAIYLKSVRSPIRNGFKIPELPKKYQKEDVFSQFVDEDSYEMDSFCVDSNIGLTQVNDVSELELAEMDLEKKKRSKRKSNRLSPLSHENGGSPLIKRGNKNSKRQILSDSDDSS